MTKATIISILGFGVLFALHHDFWNWADYNLVFGFLPVGLAWHTGFSVAAALFWLLVSRFAWPASVERWADEPND